MRPETVQFQDLGGEHRVDPLGPHQIGNEVALAVIMQPRCHGKLPAVIQVVHRPYYDEQRIEEEVESRITDPSSAQEERGADTPGCQDHNGRGSVVVLPGNGEVDAHYSVALNFKSLYV